MGLLCFQCSLATKHPMSDVISAVACSGAFGCTTYFFENNFKVMFLFHWISVLLINVAFYTYLANIVFWCDLVFNVFHNIPWFVLFLCDSCFQSVCYHKRTDNCSSRRFTEFRSQSLQPNLAKDHYSSCIYRSVADACLHIIALPVSKHYIPILVLLVFF